MPKAVKLTHLFLAVLLGIYSRSVFAVELDETLVLDCNGSALRVFHRVGKLDGAAIDDYRLVLTATAVIDYFAEASERVGMPLDRLLKTEFAPDGSVALSAVGLNAYPAVYTTGGPVGVSLKSFAFGYDLVLVNGGMRDSHTQVVLPLGHWWFDRCLEIGSLARNSDYFFAQRK